MAETATPATSTAAPPQPAGPQAVLNQYEGMFLFGAGATQDQQATMNVVRGMIEKHGGQILVLKKWDERRLAYEVEGQKRGTFIIAYFNAPGSAITPIERDVKLSEQVLRVLITRADHLNQDEMNAVEPQPIQRAEERNPWDRPFEGRDRGPREDRGPRDDRGPREEGGDRGGERGGDRGGDRGPREARPPRGPRREDAPAAAPAPADAAR